MLSIHVLGFDSFPLLPARDLHKFLDPAYTDEMTMSEEAMEEVIMAGRG